MNKWKKRTKLSSSGSAPGLIKSLKNKSWTIHLQPWIYSLALSIAQRWCILQIQSYPTRVTRVPHPRLQKIQTPNYKLFWITPVVSKLSKYTLSREGFNIELFPFNTTSWVLMAKSVNWSYTTKEAWLTTAG